ncbi:hypothetical protein EDB84DRAFT_1646509 [Lactarius hengduanensis]|nr:hypothetical protein EDB84DRAFT_1646509 [Lactarius hengduanensis]
MTEDCCLCRPPYTSPTPPSPIPPVALIPCPAAVPLPPIRHRPLRCSGIVVVGVVAPSLNGQLAYSSHRRLAPLLRRGRVWSRHRRAVVPVCHTIFPPSGYRRVDRRAACQAAWGHRRGGARPEGGGWLAVQSLRVGVASVVGIGEAGGGHSRGSTLDLEKKKVWRRLNLRRGKVLPYHLAFARGPPLLQGQHRQRARNPPHHHTLFLGPTPLAAAGLWHYIKIHFLFCFVFVFLTGAKSPSPPPPPPCSIQARGRRLQPIATPPPPPPLTARKSHHNATPTRRATPTATTPTTTVTRQREQHGGRNAGEADDYGDDCHLRCPQRCVLRGMTTGWSGRAGSIMQQELSSSGGPRGCRRQWLRGRALARICANQKDLQFTNVYSNLSRQKTLMGVIKRACSSVRNGYRELIRNSVDDDDDKNSTLDDFIYDVATRFHPSNVARFINPHTIQHVAILRRFALENPGLLGVVEVEDEDDKYVPGGGPNSEAGDGDGLTDPLRPASAASSVTANGPRGRKRKRANRHKGGDFWSMVEKWFAARMSVDQFGPANSPGWKMYIKETIDNDRKRFQPRVVENPYLADFEPGSVGVGTGTIDTEGPGNMVAASATGGSMFRAANAMASLLENI